MFDLIFMLFDIIIGWIKNMIRCEYWLITLAIVFVFDVCAWIYKIIKWKDYRDAVREDEQYYNNLNKNKL